MNQESDQRKNEIKYSKQIYYLMHMLIILAISRILSLEIFQLLSDGISALMVYFYFISRGKCMAIILLINGILGFFGGLIRSVYIYNFENTNGFTFYASLILTFSIYSIIVYGLDIYVSIIGIIKYNWEFGRQANSQYIPVEPIETNNNSTNNQRGYVPFGGRGTSLS